MRKAKKNKENKGNEENHKMAGVADSGPPATIEFMFAKQEQCTYRMQFSLFFQQKPSPAEVAAMSSGWRFTDSQNRTSRTVSDVTVNKVIDDRELYYIGVTLDEMKTGSITWDHPTIPTIAPYAHTIRNYETSSEMSLYGHNFDIQSYFWYGVAGIGILVLILAIFYMSRKKSS